MNPLYNVKPTEWINARSLVDRPAYKPDPRANIDILVSRIVGKPIMKTDRKLLRWVVEKKKHLSEEQSDHMLEIPSVVAELKQLFK